MTSSLESTVNERRQEAEQNFIACAFSAPNATRDRCGWLSPEQFRDPDLGKFWEKILAGIDPAQAAVDLNLYHIPSWVLQADLFNFDPQVSAQILIEESWLQSAGEALPEMAKAVAEHRIEDVKKAALVIAAKSPGTGEPLTDISDIGIEFLASIDNEPATVPTYIPPIDMAFGGLWRGNLTIVCARPSVGKTALAWQIARNVARNDKKVLFISLEMNRRSLWARAVCGELRIPYRDIQARRCPPEQIVAIREKTVELIDLYEHKLVVEDATRQTTADIWRLAEQFKPDVIIVDHVRLCADESKEKEVKRQGKITAELKNIAKDFDCAVLACAQLNRNPEARVGDDKRPTMSDLRDSGEIEENADIIIGIHREKQYLEKPMEKSPADLIVLKFRDGPADFVMHMIFDGMGQWFDPADQKRYSL